MNKENKIYYKIVKKIDNKLYSFFLREKVEVEYKMNEWIQAPEWLRKQGYHLFVFNTLNDCINFLKPTIWIDAKIYTCKIKDKIKKLPGKARFFHIKKSEIKYSTLYAWPTGMVMAKKVMLLEEVNNMMNIDNIKIKKCSKCKLLHVCKYRVQVEVQIRDANKFLNYSMNANAYENCIATFCKFYAEEEDKII